MSIYRGPILTVAAPYEVQQRLNEAAQSRLAGIAPSANVAHRAPYRARAAHFVDRGRSAVRGWLSEQALRRATLVGWLEQS